MRSYRAKPCVGWLKENKLKPWQQDMWCIPQVDGTYVARMEELSLISTQRKPDPQTASGLLLTKGQPGLIGEVRQPIAAACTWATSALRLRIPAQWHYEPYSAVFLDAHRPWRTGERSPGTTHRAGTLPNACGELSGR